jgi:hypothetical protein
MFSANHQRWLVENCKNGAGVFRRPTHFVCLLVIVENDDQKIARSFLAPLGALIDLMISANHQRWLAEN